MLAANDYFNRYCNTTDSLFAVLQGLSRLLMLNRR
ncbi:hypothetical protein SASC598O11_013120 [Snodgrassella alvi SCGC AB-598-O11]|nr:hypothetical protein SASC598O11_013120 [Snodgrassella alvi SCGC AB-598-O11]